MFEGARDLLSAAFVPRVTNWYTARFRRLMRSNRVVTAMNPDHLRSQLASLAKDRRVTTARVGALIRGSDYIGVGLDLRTTLDLCLGDAQSPRRVEEDAAARARGQIAVHIILDTASEVKEIVLARVFMVPGRKDEMYGFCTAARRYYWVETGMQRGWHIDATPHH